MLVSDFDFELPAELVAQIPAEPRDASRLLVYDRRDGSITHAAFRDLPEFLDPSDLLVLNNTRVLPHRLLGRRASGGKVEVLILSRNGVSCRGYIKPAKKVRPGDCLPLEDGSLTLVAGALEAGGRGVMRFELQLPEGETGGVSDVEARLLTVGRAPLPPYISRDGSEDPALDRQRYQTVFATVDGAVAAPTAGLHFTPATLAAIRARGIATAELTLHVGEGTFAPIRVEEVESHAMHAEWFEVPGVTADEVAAVRTRAGRVVAVGTTSARTLEASADGERVVAGLGETDIFLYPGRPLRVVDALITNFHLPQSTLLMLVAAMTGREEILAVYREAVARGYRFYSYGDAMLVL